MSEQPKWFGDQASCDKCGSSDINSSWCSGKQSEYGYCKVCKVSTTAAEHINRTCHRCNYQWVEKCLDHERVEPE